MYRYLVKRSLLSKRNVQGRTTTPFYPASRQFSSAKPSPIPSFPTLQDEIDEANDRYFGELRIEKVPFGYGLVASRDFRKGDKVMTSKAIEERPRDSHTIQTGDNTHVLIDLPSRFVNHACEANLGVRDNDFQAYDFYALKDIHQGEDLSFDYESTEYEIEGFEKCLCGKERCRKKLGGFKKHGDIVKKLYGQHLAKYLNTHQ